MKSTLPNFEDKVIYVQLVGERRYNLVLDKPRWEDHAGRLFLVGVIPPEGSDKDWCEGVLGGIAWDKITDYLIFESVKDYHKHIGVFKSKKNKKKS